jgi:hypothetical protein
VPALLGVTAATAVLAACGSSPTSAIDPDASVQPDEGGKPVWLCQEHVGQFIDYAQDARGAKTRTAALASYRAAGDHVVRVPRRAGQLPHVLLVGHADVIHASVELWHTQHGWLVTSVEKCAD